jgi:hypothetical protein
MTERRGSGDFGDVFEDGRRFGEREGAEKDCAFAERFTFRGE